MPPELKERLQDSIVGKARLERLVALPQHRGVDVLRIDSGGTTGKKVKATVETEGTHTIAITAAGLLLGVLGSALHDATRVVSALFPFDPALRALTGALDAAGPAIGIAIVHLAILALAYGVLARLAVRRFV